MPTNWKEIAKANLQEINDSIRALGDEVVYSFREKSDGSIELLRGDWLFTTAAKTWRELVIFTEGMRRVYHDCAQ